MQFTSSALAMMAVLSTTISATPIAYEEDVIFSSLLKRQEPGTPLYACHLACGTAIQQGREPDYCSLIPFLINYTDCLSCSGPTNLNIWQYYGATLTTRGSVCGLSTTPA